MAYSAHDREFQHILLSYERILHPPGISGPMRIFMSAGDLPLRKTHSDTHKTTDSCQLFPEPVKSIPEVRFITDACPSPKRSSHGMNQAVSM